MIKRRDLVVAAAASSAALFSASAQGTAEKTGLSQPREESVRKDGFRLALGGGAAKAFAHIPILEAMDELGVQPIEISGTSMGAILGGLYASGMTGLEIRRFAVELFTRKRQLFQKLFLSDGRTWSSIFDLGRPAIIEPIILFESIFPQGLAEDFSDLRIPMKIVATDFYKQSQVVLQQGQLLPAIAASSALPMLLTPVRIDGRVLIDGGFVNPTPFDVFDDDRYFAVGVDVTGTDYSGRSNDLPSGLETWMGSMWITLHSLVTAKLALSRPDLLIEPPIGKFHTMDFFEIEDILRTADPVKEEFKRDLSLLLEAK